MATGNDSTFGRQLMSYIQSKLPYTSNNNTIENVDELNPKYKHFFKTGTRRTELCKNMQLVQSRPVKMFPWVGLT